MGWARAVVAHAVEPGWWVGDGVHHVLVEVEPDRLPGLGTMIHAIAVAAAPQTAAVIIGLQAAVAILLVLNIRPLLALALGGAMNIVFVLAGAVNPSIFYLVLSSVIGLWTLERNLPVERVEVLAKAAIVPAVLAAMVLLPLARTLDPATAIEDPGLVLASFAGLVLVVSSVVLHRRGPKATSVDLDEESVEVSQLIAHY